MPRLDLVPLRRLADARSQLDSIKVLYTDLDGTMLGARGSFLLDPHGVHTLEPASALLKAQQAGVEVVPVSGRGLRGLQTDGRLLGMPTVIAEMGAVISYDFGNEVVTLRGQTPDSQTTPARVMEEMGAADLLTKAYGDRLEPHLPWSAWREHTLLYRGLVDLAEANALLASNGLGWMRLHDNGKLSGPYLGFSPGVARAYHLIPEGMSKGIAVAADLQRRGIKPEHAAAIGDAHADLELAQAVGALAIVSDALDDDALLKARCEELETVLVTDRPGNLGWSDFVGACLPS